MLLMNRSADVVYSVLSCRVLPCWGETRAHLGSVGLGGRSSAGGFTCAIYRCAGPYLKNTVPLIFKNEWSIVFR